MSLRFCLFRPPSTRAWDKPRFCSLDMTPPFAGDETVRGGPVEHLAGTRARTVLRVRRNVLGVLPILSNTRSIPYCRSLCRSAACRPLIIRVPAHARMRRKSTHSPGAQLKGTLDEAARRHLCIPGAYVFLDLQDPLRLAHGRCPHPANDATKIKRNNATTGGRHRILEALDGQTFEI